MTNKEINEALLKKRGYKQYIGNKDNLSPLMYFFLMDASKMIYDSDMAKRECSGMELKMRNRVKEGYHLFFKDFFSAFNTEQQDYLIEKADEYEEFISHHLFIAEVAMMECVKDKPLERQREEAKAWLCNFLAGDAQEFHGECWRTGNHKPLYNRYIDQVAKASKEYSRIRFGEGEPLTEEQFNRVQDAVTVVARKTADWLVQDYYKEIGNGKRKNETKG